MTDLIARKNGKNGKVPEIMVPGNKPFLVNNAQNIWKLLISTQ